MADPPDPVQDSPGLPSLSRTDNGTLVLRLPKASLTSCMLLLTGSAGLWLFLQGMPLAVIFRTCALLGLTGSALVLYSRWRDWRLVLDPARRYGESILGGPFKSVVRPFRFEDVRSVTLDRLDDDGRDEACWSVDIRLHDGAPIHAGLADGREAAARYAGELAQVLGTGVTEAPSRPR